MSLVGHSVPSHGTLQDQGMVLLLWGGCRGHQLGDSWALQPLSPCGTPPALPGDPEGLQL